LTDDAGCWTGGTRQLVELGDIIDRGPNSLAGPDLMKRLRGEAEAARGAVHLVMGNHECMALMAGAGSHQLRTKWMYNGGDSTYMDWAGPGTSRRDWPYPDEFYNLFSPDGEYGEFITTWRGALRIGDFVFTHAALPVNYEGDLTCFNAELAHVLSDPSELVSRGGRIAQDRLVGAAGPLWRRQFHEGALARQLERWGATTLVAGHSIKAGINQSLGGRLIQIDVGMFLRGSWAALGIDEDGTAWGLVQGGHPTRLAGHRDMLVPVPGDLGVPGRHPTSSHRFGSGDLVLLYRSPTRSYEHLLKIERVGGFYGFAGYYGTLIERSGSETTMTPGGWPQSAVDRLGKLVEPGESEIGH